jgi:hypothetical protein
MAIYASAYPIDVPDQRPQDFRGLIHQMSDKSISRSAAVRADRKEGFKSLITSLNKVERYTNTARL